MCTLGLMQLDAVTINVEGAVATLKIEGYPTPMPLYVGVAEAAAILYASGMEFRRPSTVNAWRNTLKVGLTVTAAQPTVCKLCRTATTCPDCLLKEQIMVTMYQTMILF